MEMGERDYTKATNYIDYFISRSLDLLKTRGLLCFIIGVADGTPWIDQATSEIKELIAKKADVLECHRLPEGVFQSTNTDVLADIIVLRKK